MDERSRATTREDFQQRHVRHTPIKDDGGINAASVGKSPQALAVYAATVSIGAVFLPLNTAYTPAEVAYFLGDAQPRLFLCPHTCSVQVFSFVKHAGCAVDAM